MSRIIVLIPAFEPDIKLVELVDKLTGSFEVIVVNDGSTREEAFKHIKRKCELINHKVNKGKGEALKTGLRYIHKHYKEDDVVVTADADGQHDYKDIVKIGMISKEIDNALIIGSRNFKNNTPFKSKIGNKITTLIIKRKYNIKINDTQTGLRSFKVNMIPFYLNIEGSRYEYEMNVLLECIKNNIKVIEEPIDTIYYDNNKGSHFKGIKDSIKIYKQIKK